MRLSDVAERFFARAIETKALKLGGPFNTKARRKSPHFLNMGDFAQDGEGLLILSELYAGAIQSSGIPCDVLFGPAYKGIPLAAVVALELARRGQNFGYAFNRKEEKDHGEGGTLVGAPMEDRRVLVIDDVVSAGTAFQESCKIVQAAKGTVAGLVVALDRQETMVKDGVVSSLSAVQEIRDGGMPVVAALTVQDLIEYLRGTADQRLTQHIPAIEAYLDQYGPKASGPKPTA